MDSRHQTELNNNRSKRIASNTLVLFARMLIITCVNLYSVRWVLNGLGTIDYGIFNAVAGVVTASSCISSVLALSTQRFYSYAMGQGNHEQLKEIFTVSLQIVAILSAIIIIIFELLGPWFVSTQLTIPAERLGAASWVLQFSLFSFIFTLLQIPFIGAIFSNENMGIYAIASTLDCIVKLFIAYMIGKTNADNLIFYGAAMMSEAFLLMVFYMLVAYRKYPECKYQKVFILSITAINPTAKKAIGYSFYQSKLVITSFNNVLQFILIIKLNTPWVICYLKHWYLSKNKSHKRRSL